MSHVAPSTELSIIPDLATTENLSVVPDQDEEVKQNFLPRLYTAAKHAGQTAVIMAELSPANEVLRLGAFGAGEVYSHNPAIGALTFGISTLAIESSAALASASMFSTDTSKRVTGFLKNKLTKLGYDDEKQLSKSSKIAGTLLGGSVVGMALENFDNPSRTVVENRRTGLLAAVWLSGVCAVAGAMGSETIEYTTHNPISALVVGGSAVTLAAGRKAKRKIMAPAGLAMPEIVDDNTSVWLDHDKFGFQYGLINDAERLEKLAVLEQQIWNEKDYGNLAESGYLPYIANSRTFGTFVDDEGVGINRMFIAKDGQLPPFLDKSMPYDDEEERDHIAELAEQGLAEELGTAAVLNAYRGKGVNLRLWRVAYRDARARGVKYWGIIMEPERVQKMNENQGFTFRQLGGKVRYQGGDCAAFIMDLEDVDRSMKKKHPLNHFWFVGKKIKP